MKNNIVILFYDDYPNGHPTCEEFCIDAARNLGVTVYGIGSDLDAEPYKRYVQGRLGRTPDELKSNHYADYLGYNSIEVMKSVYGINLDKVLKIDTDYLITSKFILDDLFNVDKFLIGVDNGYLIRYGNKNLPNTFLNAHLLYNTTASSHPISDIVTDEVFNEYLDEYWKNNHYTSTGPYMLNRLSIPAEHHFPVAWTTDPSGWSPGYITTKHPAGALGIHFQSSVAKSIGCKLIEFGLHGEDVTYMVITG